MGRKIRRGRPPRQIVTTDDLRQPKVLWTEADIDRLVAEAGLEIVPWQRELLVQWGGRRQLGVVENTRATGKAHAYRLTRELAVAMGHTVTDTPGGFTIELRE